MHLTNSPKLIYIRVYGTDTPGELPAITPVTPELDKVIEYQRTFVALFRVGTLFS